MRWIPVIVEISKINCIKKLMLRNDCIELHVNVIKWLKDFLKSCKRNFMYVSKYALGTNVL